MYEKETDAKVDELMSLVKAMDTKLRFVMEDLELMRTDLDQLKEIAINTAMSQTQSAAQSSKADRLDQFKQASQRW
jgi:hypothetical protein